MSAADHTPLRISVNGTRYDVTADPETPLLYVLRNDLGLHAAKYGCGLGRCGSCTVLVDGDAAFSCMVPVGDVADRDVTTLEGIGSAERLHPLQQAFLDEQAAQCGYCTAGLIMTLAALFERSPAPSDDEIRDALDATLCRCGAQVRMLRAAHRAVELMQTSQDR